MTKNKEYFQDYSLITENRQESVRRLGWKLFAILMILFITTAVLMYKTRTFTEYGIWDINLKGTTIKYGNVCAHSLTPCHGLIVSYAGACPTNLTSCPNSTGIYSPDCCANALPKSGQYCCPHGFPNCGDKTCCPSGYPTGCANGLCCPDGTRCGDGKCLSGEILTSNCSACIGTCCNTEMGGDLCCPFRNGVCCDDKINCCPGGFACGKYEGLDACVADQNLLKYEDVDLVNSTHVHVEPIYTNQSYAFIPMSIGIQATCYDEASQIYCSYDEANAASVACLMKQRTGYCSVFPSNCWNITAVGGSCYPSQSGCETPIPGSCTWYLACLQKKFKCSLDDYPVAYGFFYCQKFLANINRFDANGQKWIQNVLICLQNALVPAYENNENIVSSCTDLANIAFKSHAECYTTSSPSFCEIAKNPKNLMALFWNVYRVKDLITWRAIKQEITVLLDCADTPLQLLPVLPLVLIV